jgi:hypothetical protein
VYHSRGQELDRERNERGKGKQADRNGGQSRERSDGMRQQTLGEWGRGGDRGDGGRGGWGDQNFGTGPNCFPVTSERRQEGQASGSGSWDAPPRGRY